MIEARVIPDDHKVIANTINEVRTNHDYVFTTGGIGPTHDDITAESVALAFDVPLVVNETIANRINQQSAPERTITSRLRMARIPRGARLIDNLTGGPQGFFLENVYVMAGIPSVLQAMLPTVNLVSGTTVRSWSLEVPLGESHLAHALTEVQNSFPEIEIGSYPFSRSGVYGTSIVFRGTDTDMLRAATETTKQAIEELGSRPTSEEFDWDTN